MAGEAGRAAQPAAREPQAAAPSDVRRSLRRQRVAKSRFVIVRCLGGLDYWRYGLERVAAACRRMSGLVALPGDDRADARLAALSTVPPQSLALFDRYFRAGGTGNLANALKLAGTLLGRRSETPADPPAQLGPVVGMTVEGTPADIAELSAAGDRPWRWSSFIAPACWPPTLHPYAPSCRDWRPRG